MGKKSISKLYSNFKAYIGSRMDLCQLITPGGKSVNQNYSFSTWCMRQPMSHTLILSSSTGVVDA